MKLTITKIIFFPALVLSLSKGILIYPSSYDFASYKAQRGEWEDAHARLNNVIIDNPDKADVLHDAGVVAHKLGNAGQAVACFTRAADCAHDDNLRFGAHFKAGNAFVDNKGLQDALEQYDKALGIKPGDEYARHNRDRVAQMLKEQEQQKDDDKKDEQKDDQDKNDEEKDKQDKQDQQNQDKKDNGNDEQSGDDKQGNDEQDGDQSKQQGNDKKQDKSDKKSQGDERDDAESGEKDAQRKEHGNKEQRQKKPADDKKRNGDHELDKKSDSEHGKGDKQQGNKHNKAPEKQNETNDASNVALQDGQEQGKDDDQFGMTGITDPWLLNILNNQELQDKAINKKLMEAKVSQHGGKNGQNCW